MSLQKQTLLHYCLLLIGVCVVCKVLFIYYLTSVSHVLLSTIFESDIIWKFSV